MDGGGRGYIFTEYRGLDVKVGGEGYIFTKYRGVDVQVGKGGGFKFSKDENQKSKS